MLSVCNHFKERSSYNVILFYNLAIAFILRIFSFKWLRKNITSCTFVSLLAKRSKLKSSSWKNLWSWRRRCRNTPEIWFKRFNEVDTSLLHKQRTSHLSDINDDKLCNTLQKRSHSSYRELSTTLIIPKSIFYGNLKHLDYEINDLDKIRMN